MGRGRKEVPSFLSCAEAIAFVYDRHVRTLVNSHTRYRRMQSERAYCAICRAEFCLTMRPEGCPDRADEPCTTCFDALAHVCTVVLPQAQQAGGHLPVENVRRTAYACCHGCNTHTKLTTYTGAASPWWELHDGGCFRRAVAAMFHDHHTAPIYATIPNHATRDVVEQTCRQFGLQIHYGSVELLEVQPSIVLYIVQQRHGHAVYTCEPQRYHQHNVFAVITKRAPEDTVPCTS